MATVNKEGYIEVRGRGRHTKKIIWLIKPNTSSTRSKTGHLGLSRINLPERYVGKRVRLRLEVI